ncbi:OprD family outer membrane porin [Sulfurimonas sp.]|uniref:OprD family outer membrane porin n=1 Tax=Sulfurimonas sp. TaxID=2022749 RepID=UPI0026304A41|nr:OprD family outer membrane porin [Sulfurimonas sp.]MDD5158168.1 OprD family outer membrane porin [Sulfurimonas sp.]
MKKLAILLFVAVTSLFATGEDILEKPTSEAKKFSEILKLGEMKGQARVLYQTNSHNEAGNGTEDLLVGGKISFETTPLYAINLKTSFYMVYPILNRSSKDHDYYNPNGDGYSMLGEMFVKYASNDMEIKLGQMELDLPLINSDDIRMIPNLFTAALVNYLPSKELKLTTGIVSRMAGWENSSDHSKFVKLGEVINNTETFGNFFADNPSAINSRLFIIGAAYESENFTLDGWFYRQTKMLDTYYTKGSIKAYKSDAMSINLMAQYMSEKSIGKLDNYSKIDYAAKVDCDIYGAAIELESETIGLKWFLAYNKSGKNKESLNDGGTADFFGGAKDSLFTSMDVETANCAGDVSAYKIGVEFDLEKVGFKGTNIAIAHANFYRGVDDTTKKETDFRASYILNKQANIEMMLSKIEDEQSNTNNRARIFIKYNF